MLFKTAFNFSSVVQRWVCRFSGLRLVALRWFLVFLASSRCAASASSYCFGSAAPPRWRCAFSQFVPVAKFRLSVLASGSNISVKPTRILRSAYLARWAAHRTSWGTRDLHKNLGMPRKLSENCWPLHSRQRIGRRKSGAMVPPNQFTSHPRNLGRRTAVSRWPGSEAAGHHFHPVLTAAAFALPRRESSH